MADEKKGPKVSDLKARLGLKTEGGAPTGTVPPPGAALPNVPPPGVSLPGVPAPTGAAPLVAPPGVSLPGVPAPLVAPPGMDLPRPPEPEPAPVAAPVYAAPEPEPYYEEDNGNLFQEEPEAKPTIGKSLWWVKFAVPSAVVGLALGLYLGAGSYAGTFNETRRVPVGQIQSSAVELMGPMDTLTSRVIASKDGDIDVKLLQDITEPLSKVNLLSPDALKQYSATFMKADTLRLLFQYQFLTKQFFDALRDHQKQTEKSKEELLAAKAGKLEQPRYAAVLLDNTDQGGVIIGQVCTLIGEPKVEVKEEPEPVDEEDPNASKAPPKMIKVTYKTYKLKNGFYSEPFERQVRVQSDGSESVRAITNVNELVAAKIIPNYGEALLYDYQERVRLLKLLAENVKSVQGELKAALEADVARQISFF